MPTPRLLLLLAAAGSGARFAAASSFIGRFNPLRRAGGPSPSSSEPPQPAPTGGLSDQEIRTLLAGRTAVVVAAEATEIGMAVTEGLVDVGANVTFACRSPTRCAAQCARVNARARARNATGSCVLAPVDVSDEAAVWQFAEARASAQLPLHVIVNCADDVNALYSRAPRAGSRGEWERTLGANHLGPFLLTQLLLDQMVATMRRDADAYARVTKRRRREGERRGAGAEKDAGADDEPPEIRARPHPAPFGRVVSLGLACARPSALLAPTSPDDVLGTLALRPGRRSYSPWGAYRAAHEANLLNGLFMANAMRAGPGATEAGDRVEMNLVHPGGARWLPRPLRRFLRIHDDAALTATFLASTPVVGMTGLYFRGFETAPPASNRAEPFMGAAAYRRAYEASTAVSGAPRLALHHAEGDARRGRRARLPPRRAAVLNTGPAARPNPQASPQPPQPPARPRPIPVAPFPDF